MIFLKYLNHACKTKSVTICLVRSSIQISKPVPINQNILLRLDSFEKPYKQLELVFHRDIRTLENNGQKHSRCALVCFHHCSLVFGYPGETTELYYISGDRALGCRVSAKTWRISEPVTSQFPSFHGVIH